MSSHAFRNYFDLLFFADIESINSTYGASVIERASKKPRKPLKELLPGAPEDAIDLVMKLLHFNPDRRPTADQILKHPYVKRYSELVVS